MARHITLNDLILRQRGLLSAEESAALAQHLADCPACAQNVELLKSMEAREKSATEQSRQAPATKDCVSHEDLAMFLNGELSGGQMRRLAKHLAQCDSCREKLAEIIRASASPLSKEERAKVTTQSKLVIAEQLRAIEDLFEKQSAPPGDTLLIRMRRLFETAFSSKLAWAAAVLLVTLALGLQPLRERVSAEYLTNGMELMQDVYPIPGGAPRPHGFQTGMFSPHHSDPPTEKLLAIEKNLQKALSWSTNNRAARRAQALYCGFRGKYECADSTLHVLLHENERDAVVWNDLGFWALQREDTIAAVAAFDKALTLQPNDETVKQNRKLLPPTKESKKVEEKAVNNGVGEIQAP